MYIRGSSEYCVFFVLCVIAGADPKVGSKGEIGVLDQRVSDCFFKLKGSGADALHPFWRGIDLPKERLKGYAVRAWLTGHLYPEKPTGGRLDLEALNRQGITDVFLNEPEKYL